MLIISQHHINAPLMGSVTERSNNRVSVTHLGKQCIQHWLNRDSIFLSPLLWQHQTKTSCLTKPHRQQYPPCAVQVAWIISWEPWAQEHSFHLFCCSSTLGCKINSVRGQDHLGVSLGDGHGQPAVWATKKVKTKKRKRKACYGTSTKFARHCMATLLMHVPFSCPLEIKAWAQRSSFGNHSGRDRFELQETRLTLCSVHRHCNSAHHARSTCLNF